MRRILAAFFFLPLSVLAQHPHEAERQRALIELDRRSAPLAEPQQPLPPEVGQPLAADPEVARQLRPYERMREARERERLLELPPPMARERSGSDPELEAPLPLPGRPQRAVDPVTLPGGSG